jgi:hypothetical protein
MLGTVGYVEILCLGGLIGAYENEALLPKIVELGVRRCTSLNICNAER